MFAELISLGVTAVSIGFVHCVCGPDHYVPFIAMSRVGLWSLRKTLVITALCGVGHVLSSAVIAFIGIALGLIVSQLEGFESIRGTFAGWLLFGFGVLYMCWGIYYALRRGASSSCGQRDVSIRAAVTEVPSSGEHASTLLSNINPYASAMTEVVSAQDHAKAETLMKKSGEFTPWVLFTIFLFGPCEPLIPMLMVPASKANFLGVVWVTLLFGVTTLFTMLSLVTLFYQGMFAIRLQMLQQWGHALAGSVVTACGASILFLGL